MASSSLPALTFKGEELSSYSGGRAGIAQPISSSPRHGALSTDKIIATMLNSFDTPTDFLSCPISFGGKVVSLHSHRICG